MTKIPKDVRNLPLEERAVIALQVAVAKAIEEHARAGRSIFIAKNGKVVELPAKAVLAGKSHPSTKGRRAKGR